MKFEGINEVCIKWRKELDNAILGEIKQKAIEHGIKIEYILNEKAIISALEKQIPKKPTHEATLYKCCTCPNCKNVVDEFTEFMGNRCRVTPAYCKYCGQALVWSDTE